MIRLKLDEHRRVAHQNVDNKITASDGVAKQRRQHHRVMLVG